MMPILKLSQSTIASLFNHCKSSGRCVLSRSSSSSIFKPFIAGAAAISSVRSSSANAPTSASNAAAATPKLAASLQSELQYEKSNYEPAATISSFLEKAGWTLSEKDGDINITLKKQINDLAATVEFQLVAPTYAGENEEEEVRGENRLLCVWMID